ncbi:hypothetical protein Tco_0662273, partial [Tanacetum coccineum]
SDSKGAEFKVTFPRNCVVRLPPMAAIMAYQSYYIGNAQDEDDKEVACDDGCFSKKKKTWSIG